MKSGLRNALILISLFVVGIAGGLAFTEVEPEGICEGTYVEEFFHYSETSDDFGYTSEGEAVSAETESTGSNRPEYSVQQLDPVADAGTEQWVISADGKNVAAFSIYQTGSGRFVVSSRLACVQDDGVTPVDANLNLSQMTDFQDFSASG